MNAKDRRAYSRSPRLVPWRRIGSLISFLGLFAVGCDGGCSPRPTTEEAPAGSAPQHVPQPPSLLAARPGQGFDMAEVMSALADAAPAVHTLVMNRALVRWDVMENDRRSSRIALFLAHPREQARAADIAAAVAQSILQVRVAVGQAPRPERQALFVWAFGEGPAKAAADRRPLLCLGRAHYDFTEDRVVWDTTVCPTPTAAPEPYVP